MCDHWKNAFENFLADMGQRPSTNYSIDRINNNGNYEPGNCRWATREEQANNTRTNKQIKFGSETKTMSQWADSIGVAREVIFKRLKRGVPKERILDPLFVDQTFAFNGVVQTLPEWSAATGIKRATLYWRINKKNWPLERALTTGTSI